jgi:hypothetical protein
MRKTLLVAALAAWVGATGMSAQEGQPKPGPEHKRLEYFVGTWNFVGDFKGKPPGPVGPTAAKQVCEMFEGGFALICRSDGKTPQGPGKSISIFGYDVDKKVYSYTSAESSGPVFIAYGQVSNGTWNFKTEMKMAGRDVVILTTLTEKSRTAYDIKMAFTVDGGTPTTIVEGKTTKIGA